MKPQISFDVNLGLGNNSLEFMRLQKIINISLNITHLILVGLLFFITFFLPGVWIIVLIPLTVVSLVFGIYPSYLQPFLPRTTIITSILEIMKELKILSFFLDLHALVFYTKTKIYYFFYAFCFGLTGVYLVASRYNFYKIYIWKEAYSFGGEIFIGIILLFGVLGSYLRTLINFSNIVVVITREYSPDLLDPILRVEPPDFPQGSDKSLLNFSRNTYNYHVPPTPKTSRWGRGNWIFAGITTLVGVGTYYQVSRQTEFMERQTKTMEEQTRLNAEQTYELRRQNDLKEVDQGFMSKEDYDKRYPKK